jgi:hypothetical protein
MWNLNGPYSLMDMDETLTIVRQGRLADTDVVYVGGLPMAAHAPTVFTITATWQPMGGKDLLIVPEAFREQQNARMWQAHYNPAPDAMKVDIGDVVVREGMAWQVQTAMDWGDYTETTCRAIDVGSLSDGVVALIVDPDTGLVIPPAIYPLNPVVP